MSSEIDDDAIVVHGPLSGDRKRIERLPEELRGATPPDEPVSPLPPGIRDPRVAREAAPGTQASADRVRVFGLDVVRGISLLLMNLTFALPFEKLLPAWMYHMQYPPPDGKYAPLPGLTWQDIIFPGFLFAMAAAIPIRSSQLLAAGASGPRIAWGAVQRAALLYVFSLIIAHVNPYYTNDYTKRGNVLAIAGFLTSFALFVRIPRNWSPAAGTWLRRAGWAAAAIILFVLPATWGAAFSPTRRDSIITSIAFVYALTSVLWLATLDRTVVRLLVMLAIAVLKLLAPVAPVVGAFWAESALPWLYEPWFFELMLLSIPGTIAGDLLVRWIQVPLAVTTERALSPARLRIVALLGFIAPVVLLVGLYQRKVVATTGIVLGLVLLGGALLASARTSRDRLLAQMGGWAGALLIVGTLLEPLEGGIKKDPQTMSFLLVCAGLWFGVLLASTIIIDVIKGAARRLADPLIQVGQNAMLAYVVFMLFFNHIAYLLGFGDFLSETPAQALARGGIITLFVMTVLWIATRRGIIWRS